MPTALITGASRGIGREVAKELAREGYTVLLGVRDPGAAPALRGARAEQVDVASPQSIGKLAARVPDLDLLVNNAGVYQAPRPEIWAVNVRGPLLLTRALLPKLNHGARVVMVTSGLGSLASQSVELSRRLRDPALKLDDILALCDEMPGGYGASKATLNAMARLFAEELRSRGILVNATDPGWVRTDMGGSGAPRSIAQGAASVLWACRLPPTGPTGGVFRDGVAAG
ncbi:MAG: SDR family NAD(P)-dependent oxidoreductase [Deltaproteobacteria bacterium]|nr:MAG: SDR family NAD(P)-dependent oxidoreductase [Deltaproteobacteria bacterium]TMB29347.1 MAG: SDR family NAD(P)-dependent oxidoreductase [Deltaproteobacteria bacterium]TMB34389.1 MAG: SDR family NAD(P)-dependent oxidoreductase [Deltaproteobacteria bacterium]